MKEDTDNIVVEVHNQDQAIKAFEFCGQAVPCLGHWEDYPYYIRLDSSYGSWVSDKQYYIKVQRQIISFQEFERRYLTKSNDDETTFKVGDWVVLTKSDKNWVPSMNTDVGRVVQISGFCKSIISKKYSIDFEGRTWEWTYTDGHFRKAELHEIPIIPKDSTERDVDLLIEEAKVRYPKGTVFVSPYSGVRYTSDGTFYGGLIGLKTNGSYVYYYSRWAEVVPKPENLAVGMDTTVHDSTGSMSQPLGIVDTSLKHQKPIIIRRKEDKRRLVVL